MKALVLCGGIPQIALIEELKSRGIITVLADKNERVEGRKYADIFYPVSTLDIERIKNVAIQEQVDFIITVCADQVLQVVAEVSEMLGLPCYIDYKTARNVSQKSYMKKIFEKNGIPTSKYSVMKNFDETMVKDISFPMIVKPVDSYSSRGVKKVYNIEELKNAFWKATEISRTDTAIIEEYVEGRELTVDVYVEGGEAKLLCISELDKISSVDRFVIYRTKYPADISDKILKLVEITAQKIADAFKLKNTPMLIQLLTNGEKISVVEFCARTGGGDKFRLIKKVSGFDVIKAAVDLELGKKPHAQKIFFEQKYIVNEFLYCKPGKFDHLEGFEELVQEGIITEYFQLKPSGAEFTSILSSGDRVAYFTIEDSDVRRLKERHKNANCRIKAVNVDGKDMLRHDLIDDYGNERGGT